MKRATVLLCVMTLSLGLPAAAQEAFRAPAIKRMASLPVQGIQVVESEDGELVFLSTNGRYAFRAGIDLWHGRKLTDFNTATGLADRINLAALKLDVADLGALDSGEGPELIAFVDPFCPHCTGLFEAIPDLSARYRLRLVPLPVLGEDSQRAVLKLHCAAETDPAAALAALRDHSALSDLPEPTEVCGMGSAQRALIAAQMLGIQGTPYLIAPDGRMRIGLPEDLAAWLAPTEDTP